MSFWESHGKSDEWYTPKHVFDALECTFDLDVAAPARSSSVPARRFFTADSLESPWNGIVWMNPPFGGRSGLVPWLDKFFDHGDGVALAPNRTSAPWFRDAWKKADAVLFTPKLKFLKPDGSLGKSPSNSAELMAAGTAVAKLYVEALRTGVVLLDFPPIVPLVVTGDRSYCDATASFSCTCSGGSVPIHIRRSGINGGREMTLLTIQIAS